MFCCFSFCVDYLVTNHRSHKCQMRKDTTVKRVRIFFPAHCYCTNCQLALCLPLPLLSHTPDSLSSCLKWSKPSLISSVVLCTHNDVTALAFPFSISPSSYCNNVCQLELFDLFFFFFFPVVILWYCCIS